MRRSLKRTLFCLSILLAMAAMSGCATRAIGQIQYWPMQEGQRHGTAFPLFYLSGDWTFPAVRLSGTGDIDGDGQEDIVWQHRDGLVQYWKMHDGQHKQTITVDAPVPEEWTLAGVGDLDGDGDDDIVWQHRGGQVRYWEMQDGRHVAGVNVDIPVPEAWTLAAVGDVDADGDDDIIWRHCNGQVRYWEMQDGLNLAGMDLGTPTPSDWTLAGAGDVDGDRDDDIIWQDQAGQVFYWEVEDGQRLNDVNIDVAAAEDWSISGIGDLDGDADDDIVWQHHDDIVDYGTVRASQFKQYEKTADNGKNAKCTWYIMRGSSEASLASADQIQFDAYAFGIPSLFLDHHNHIWTAGLVKFDFPIPTYTVVLEWQALVNVVLPQGVIISDDDDSVILDLVVREQTQSVSFPRSLDDIEDDEWIYTNPRIYYDNESTNTRRPREERLVLSGEFIVGGGEATSLIIGPSMLISSDKSSWASIGSEKDRADDGIFYFNGLDHDCLLKSSCTRTGLEVYYTMRPYYVHVGPISLVGIPR